MKRHIPHSTFHNPHSLTKCWRRTPWQVILLLFAVPFFIRNLLMPMAADDSAYAFVWSDDDLGNLMDIIGPRIYSDDKGTCVALKDGRSFIPILAGKMASPDIGKEGFEYLGLRLVNNIVENISYKYMYGLNVVLIN